MKITAIKAQVKNTERISIYVDEKYSFSLGYNQLLDQKLHVGLEVDDARIAELKHISDFGKAYERALNYVMIRPRSVREVRDYARRKKWSPEDTAAIIDKLQTRRYLDDANFARAWVESRVLGGKTSRRKLQMELKTKGVAEDSIKRALEQAKFDDSHALKELIAKKRRLPKYAADDQKLMQYLARQGFSFDDIKQALAN
jgi:regulatory protein